MLIALVVLTLVPRAIMAWKIDTLCPDAVLYVDIAESLERGDFRTAMVQMKLNVFPVVLLLLHRLGLDWQTAGEVWNVAISTAAVLPLVGWIRRQFDQHVAYAAGFLYATHARLIERSPEVIRDPTFWFLFLFTIYCLWRAINEVRLTRFVTAGIALWLAVLTRFEGLFLIALLIGWSALRYRTLRTGRWRLVGGAVLAIGLVPVLSATMLPWSAPHMRSFDLVRMEPLERARLWLDSWSAPEPVADQLPPDSTWLSAPSTPGMVTAYLDTILKGVEIRAALLLLVGLVASRRSIGRNDNLPIFFLIFLFLSASWIHLWYSGAISSRYVISVFLLTVPWSATGLIWVAAHIAAPRFEFSTRSHAGLAAAVFLIVAVVGWSDALSSPFHSRRELAAIGDWIQTQFGDGAVVQIAPERAAIINHYAHTHCVELINPRPALSEDVSDHSLPSVIVLDSNRADLEARFQPDFQRLPHIASRRFDYWHPPGKPRFIVLVRQPMPGSAVWITKKPDRARGL